MANPKITNYDMGGILLGNNQFETGTLALAKNDSITNGAFLERNSAGKFVIVKATSGDSAQTPVAMYIGDDITASSAAIDVAIRALIGGRVKASVCNVNGTAATAAQLDMIRSYGIIPVAVTETNVLDNQ